MKRLLSLLVPALVALSPLLLGCEDEYRCQKDTECKGSRLCIDGVCQAPQADDVLQYEDVLQSDDGLPETEQERPMCLFETVSTLNIELPVTNLEGPDIMFDGERLAVAVMESSGDIHSTVSYLSLPLDLSDWAGPTLIGEETHAWGEIAWSGDVGGLCWYSDPAMVGRTAFRRFDRTGGRIGQMVDLDFDGGACIALEYGGGHFLAAWRHRVQDGDETLVDARLQLLNNDGTLIGTPLDLSRGVYPGHATNVVWQDPTFMVAMATVDQIELYWIDSAGRVADSHTIPAPNASHVELAERDGSFVLAWLTGERYEYGLHVQVFGANRQPLRPVWTVVQDGGNARYPDLITLPDGWLLTYVLGVSHNPYAAVLHLDPQGVPLEPRIVLYQGINSRYGGPSAILVDQDVYVALSTTSPESGREQLQVQQLDCRVGTYDICEPQDARLDVTCDDGIPLGWVWTGSECDLLTGCEGDCAGADCGRLAFTQADCLSDHEHCH